jgi:hypothetical protein
MVSRARIQQFLRSVVIVGVSVFLVMTLFRLADAGSLTPSTAPAATMNSIEEIYESLVGTYDSSAVVADDDGSALEISKCIIDVVNGGAGCP